jgi:hypothetical protein
MPTRLLPLLGLLLLGLPACRQEAAPTSTPARPDSRLTRSLAAPEQREEPVVLVRPGGTEPTAAVATQAPQAVAAVPASAPVDVVDLAQAVPAAPLAPAPAEDVQRRRGNGEPPRQERGALNRIPLGVSHGDRLDGTRPRRRDHPELSGGDGPFKPTPREDRGQDRVQDGPQGRRGG